MIDFGILFSQLASSFWLLLSLLILVKLFKSPWFKGFIGEVIVNMAARLFLNINDYHLIKNVAIPNGVCKDMVFFKQLNNSCLTPPTALPKYRAIIDIG
jgi:hypothetical protein